MVMLLLVAALLGTPDGFRESVRLAPAVSHVAGKPAFVRCATTDGAWSAMLMRWSLPRDVDALTFPNENGTYFSRPTCRALEGWMRGKNAPSPAELGPVALSLAHEAQHVRGIIDEGEAECRAVRHLPTLLRQWFGIRRAVTLKRVMTAAMSNHRAKPAEYRAVC